MNVEDRIKKAHLAIMRHKEFCVFSGVLACGKVTVTTGIPTACTNGWDRMYNPEFVETHLKDDAQLRFVVLHEAMHVAYRHLKVWRALHNENPMLANIAADYFVNGALVKADKGKGFIKLPEVGIKPEAKYDGWSVQMIYADLKRQQQGGKGGNGGDGDGSGNFDSHDWENAADGKAEELQEAEVQRAMRQGEALRQKRMGRGGGDLDGVIGDLLTPKIDWRTVLREFVEETCTGRDESSWRKPSRRFLSENIYMPSMVGVTMRELAVVLDTSGSCFTSEELTMFTSELAAVIERVRPSKVHVLYVDSRVAGHQVFEDGQFAVGQMQVKGGGGTDLTTAFTFLKENNIDPQAMIVLTDGYTPFGHAPSYPVLWAMSTDIVAPYGVTIRLE